MNRFCLLLLPLALVACSDAVTPKMIQRAQFVCEPLGGLRDFERYDDGRADLIEVRCTDGTSMVTPVSPVASKPDESSAPQSAASEASGVASAASK